MLLFSYANKNFPFWRLSNDCQIVRPALISSPPNRKKPYNKHLLSYKHRWNTRWAFARKLDIFTRENDMFYFFPSLRAGGIFQILQSDWFRERAVFLRSCPLTRAESLAASFTSLFVVVDEQNRWFRTVFLLKLALLLASAREKWILLFRQNIWRENQASEPGKPLK